MVRQMAFSLKNKDLRNGIKVDAKNRFLYSALVIYSANLWGCLSYITMLYL